MGEEYIETDIFFDGEVPEVNPNKKNDDYGNDERAIFQVMNYPFCLFLIIVYIFFDKVSFWVCLAIYLWLTSFINIRYFRRKRAIQKSNGYPARIIAVQLGTREYGGRYKATIGTYGLKVKYAEGVKCIFVSDCKIKQEVKDHLKFWL